MRRIILSIVSIVVTFGALLAKDLPEYEIEGTGITGAEGAELTGTTFRLQSGSEPYEGLLVRQVK